MSIEKLYWDSDCFLAFLQAEQGKAEKCEGTLERANRGEVLIVTSTLTIAEVLWKRGSPRLARDKATSIEKFFRRSYFRIIDVTRKIAQDAQWVVWDNDIRPKDAIHVATALHHKIACLETFDGDLIRRSGAIGGNLLLIREPIAAVQTVLPFPPAQPGARPN